MGSSILSEVDDTSILRTGLSTRYCRSSRLATDLSALAPAQRAGAQRLCALARTGSNLGTDSSPISEEKRKTFALSEHYDPSEWGVAPVGSRVAEKDLGVDTRRLVSKTDQTRETRDSWLEESERMAFWLRSI